MQVSYDQNLDHLFNSSKPAFKGQIMFTIPNIDNLKKWQLHNYFMFMIHNYTLQDTNTIISPYLYMYHVESANGTAIISAEKNFRIVIFPNFNQMALYEFLTSCVLRPFTNCSVDHFFVSGCLQNDGYLCDLSQLVDICRDFVSRNYHQLSLKDSVKSIVEYSKEYFNNLYSRTYLTRSHNQIITFQVFGDYFIYVPRILKLEPGSNLPIEEYMGRLSNLVKLLIPIDRINLGPIEIFMMFYGDLQCRNCGQFLSSRWAIIHKCNELTALFPSKYDTTEFEDLSNTYQKYVAKNQLALLLRKNGELVYNNLTFKKLVKLANKCRSENGGKKIYNSQFVNFRPNLFRNDTDIGTILENEKRIINGTQQFLRKRLQMSGIYSVDIPNHYRRKFNDYVNKFQEPFLIPTPKKKLYRSAHIFTNIDVPNTTTMVTNEVRIAMERGFVNQLKRVLAPDITGEDLRNYLE